MPADNKIATRFLARRLRPVLGRSLGRGLTEDCYAEEQERMLDEVMTAFRDLTPDAKT